MTYDITELLDINEHLQKMLGKFIDIFFYDMKGNSDMLHVYISNIALNVEQSRITVWFIKNERKGILYIHSNGTVKQDNKKSSRVIKVKIEK